MNASMFKPIIVVLQTGLLFHLWRRNIETGAYCIVIYMVSPSASKNGSNRHGHCLRNSVLHNHLLAFQAKAFVKPFVLFSITLGVRQKMSGLPHVSFRLIQREKGKCLM